MHASIIEKDRVLFLAEVNLVRGPQAFRSFGQRERLGSAEVVELQPGYTHGIGALLFISNMTTTKSPTPQSA